MTLILASGDHHFEQGPRWAECLRVHAWIAEQVESLRPALFLSGGDIYERASTPVERAAVAEWLTRIAEVCPVVAVRGNHDRALDVELLGRLRTRHPVTVEERAGVHTVAGVAVAAFAWPSRALLASVLGEHASPETVAQHGREALRNVLRGLGAELAQHDGPRVLLGHAQVVGARVGVHGQPLAPGAEITVGLEDLALAGADAVVLGHIHAAQEWHFGGTSMLYTGSPFRNTFGEAERKSIAALHFASVGWHPGDRHGEEFRFERIETPCTRMVLLEGCYANGELRCEWDGGEPVDDIHGHRAELHFAHSGQCTLESGNPQTQPMYQGDVRLRYRVAAEEREAGRACAENARAFMLEHFGPASVKLDEVVLASTRARAPEVAEARSTWAQLEAFWAARGDAPAAERRPELARKVGEIESETAR
jgi:hypothetical protein